VVWRAVLSKDDSIESGMLSKFREDIQPKAITVKPQDVIEVPA